MPSRIKAGLASLFLGIPLAACTTTSAVSYIEQPERKPEPKTVTAYGLGSIPKNSSLSAAQQELMAMRAAKLDAYRAIAEQVKGLRVIGTTTVNDLATSNDTIRSFVDASLKNVRILSITPKGNGIYEAMAEMTLEPEVVQRLWSSVSTSAFSQCTVNPCASDFAPVPVAPTVPVAITPPVTTCSVCGQTYYYHAP
jgi:hypothetical protein